MPFRHSPGSGTIAPMAGLAGMKGCVRAAVALLFACALLPAALADDVTAVLYSAGDPAAGEAKYGQACVACHGPAGVSQVPSQPSLAGQHPEYLLGQMRAYQEGGRLNAVMQGMVAGLTEQEMVDLAVYLHRQAPALAGAADRALAEAGRDIYRGGVAATGAPACLGCHGPAGKGIPPAYPSLGGQHAEYTVTTMLAFRDGTRANPVMNAIAARLTEEQIRALAEYISGLH